VFRIERGRMRNEWFPAMKAEYMTASRFRELGLTREDIGDRDTTFGTMAAADDIEDTPVFEAPKAVLTTSVCIPRNSPPRHSRFVVAMLITNNKNSPKKLTLY
jgi:hypothetical protein